MYIAICGFQVDVDLPADDVISGALPVVDDGDGASVPTTHVREHRKERRLVCTHVPPPLVVPNTAPRAYGVPPPRSVVPFLSQSLLLSTPLRAAGLLDCGDP